MQAPSTEKKTFEFHFRYYKLYQEYFSFKSIGWEYWQHPQKYFINPISDSNRQYVFQYTVSGEGAITINSRLYSLKPGQAFLIECPGDVTYCLPRGSHHWELKFVSLNAVGNNILRNIINEYGNVFTLPQDSLVMEYWEKIYDRAIANDMNNFFTASSQAYAFIMALNDTLRRIPKSHCTNNPLQICIDTIQANYRESLTLGQLADICNISPSYLSKIFKNNFKMTPIQYLINYRIEQATHMLLLNNLSIEDIALRNGFSSANYFSRIFKKVMGVSPLKYRQEGQQEFLSGKESQQLTVHYELWE